MHQLKTYHLSRQQLYHTSPSNPSICIPT